MATFDERYERQEKLLVQVRGLGLIALSAFFAAGPFVTGALLAAVLSLGGLIGVLTAWLVGLSVVGLALSPLVLVAGLVDLFRPRTRSCPPDRLQL